MSRVFWDTNLFIYLFEGHGERSERVESLRNRMTERGDQLYTSALTLGELLAKPLEEGNQALALRYEEAVTRSAVVLSFGVEAAQVYARLRGDRGLRALDAVQLACAAQAQVDLFITNDDRLSRRLVPGIQFVTSLSAAPL